MPYSRPPSVWLRPAAQAAASMVIAAGVSFSVSVATPNGVSESRLGMVVKTESGGQVAAFTESGSLALSGASLTVGDGNTGSGKTSLVGADGGKICLLATDGAGYTVHECNDGTCTPRAATGSECP